ncbi:retention module-containing protein, partial [Comamonas sp. UBA7528]|uniref:retention module-containing protein n=1 Tax=Comamonas sp. UBA7528 TaxID=1946391 RepID=UPI0025B887CE
MASTPVLVTQLTGQAWVRDADGNLTPLRQGMRIPADAEVVTASGSTVVLQADGQPPLVLGENQDVALSPDVFEDIPATEAAVPTTVDPLVENLIAAINNGQDPLAELDPTAATNAGGGGGDHTFVRLASVLEATTPLALAYPRPASDVVEDRLGGAAGTTLPPLYEGTLTLSAQQQVTEGGMIIVTATVDRAPRGSDLVITLRTGEVIIIRVGETSGSVEIPTRTDDAYVQGTDPHLFEVGSTTGGGYDRLDTTSTTSTNVVDDQDPTEIVLSADTQVTEGGKITVTATVDKAPQGSDLVITLKTGETITIKVGELTGSVLTDSRPDDGYLQGTQGQQFEIAQAEGGNYEVLDTSSTTSTQVQDDADTVTVKLTATQATGEHGRTITYTASLVDAAGKPVTT